MVLEDSIDTKTQAVRAAYDGLSADERAMLEMLTERLAAALRDGNPQRTVGPETCKEIIGKLGMWLVEAECPKSSVLQPSNSSS